MKDKRKGIFILEVVLLTVSSMDLKVYRQYSSVPCSFLAISIPVFSNSFVLSMPICLQPEELTSQFCADILTLLSICFLVTLMFLPPIRPGKDHVIVSECGPEP